MLNLESRLIIGASGFLVSVRRPQKTLHGFKFHFGLEFQGTRGRLTVRVFHFHFHNLSYHLLPKSPLSIDSYSPSGSQHSNHLPSMSLNLTACGLEFTNPNHNYTNYTYDGPIRGILKNVQPRPPLITVQGCRDLCGSGSDYYSWTDVSSTITTWVRTNLA